LALTVQSSAAALGTPSPDLSTYERLALAAYLTVNRPALRATAADPVRTATLDVEPGMDAAQVAELLGSLGILERPDVFLQYLRYRGLDVGIDAGRFDVRSDMTILELAEVLQQAEDTRYAITVREGWRREEVAETLEALDLDFSAGEFLEATRRPPPAWAQAPSGAGDLEGFLFPDTYHLDPRGSADEVAAEMVGTLERRLSPDLLAGFTEQGLTPFEAVTLASIVEREAAVPSERPLIASVFLNRLRLEIPLQADPTVQFAVGRTEGGWWKAPLTAEDLRFDSPYNTYVVGGLPPGPIASPGLASLEAVAAPADTAFLFFRAACDGSGRHVFATTFEEHAANACP
jgi:UPF0755 protein